MDWSYYKNEASPYEQLMTHIVSNERFRYRHKF